MRPKNLKNVTKLTFSIRELTSLAVFGGAPHRRRHATKQRLEEARGNSWHRAERTEAPILNPRARAA